MPITNGFIPNGHRLKTVNVRRYRRFRFGAWEDVCRHRRRPPR